MALTVSQSGTATGASTTPTASINITEAANQTLVVLLGVDDTVVQSASFTYDSVAVSEAAVSTGTGQYVWVGILKNPNSGSSLSLSGTIANNRTWGLIWLVLTDNDQTTAHDSGTIQISESASATTSGVTVTSETNDLVISFINVNNKAATTVTPSGTGQTSITELTPGENACALEATYTAGDTSITTAWSWSGAAAKTEIALNFNLTSGGGGGSPYKPRRAALLGVG